MTATELIANIANIALAVSVVTALIFGIAQVMAAARDRRERLTMETLQSFQTREFAEHIQYIVNTTMPETREEFRALTAAEQVNFIQFAQKMEHLGIAVADGLVDMELVDKTLGSFVAASWLKYKTFFLDMRKKEPDPFLGEYFQWLAERIEERMQKHPREPFYRSHRR